MKIKAYGKAAPDLVEAFQKEIGFQLPEDYQKFLLEYNGGTPQVKYSTFEVAELEERISLHVLYGLGLEKNIDLKTWHSEYKEDLFETTIIIGHDFGTGLIVLYYGDPEQNGVYYWDHAFEFELSNADHNVYFVADSFQEFLAGLKEPDQE